MVVCFIARKEQKKMNSINLLGRLTKDVEVRYTSGDNLAIAHFTLAVDRHDKEKHTDFINCVSFGAQAENLQLYCKKGSQIAVSGRLQSGSYEDKDGKKIYTFDVYCNTIDYTSTKGGDNTTEAPKNEAKPKEEEYIPQFEAIGDDEDIPF